MTEYLERLEERYDVENGVPASLLEEVERFLRDQRRRVGAERRHSVFFHLPEKMPLEYSARVPATKHYIDLVTATAATSRTSESEPPPACEMILTLDHTRFKQVHPAEPATFNCDEENVKQVTGDVVERLHLGSDRIYHQFG